MSRGSGSPVLEILVAFTVVFLLQLVTALADLVGGLFVLRPPVTEDPWTVVTSVYAHANLGHLVSNALGLVVFGWPVARATTRIRFHAFFLVAGSLAGVAQILLSGALASSPVVALGATPGVLGASGGVFALLGYLLASNRLSSRIGAVLQISRTATLLGFVLIAAVLTLATASPGVALIAHFVGLLLGLVAGRAAVLDVGRR
ncbi:MAG: rhomboid family intramembrane serine protease [Halovenus sp.]